MEKTSDQLLADQAYKDLLVRKEDWFIKQSETAKATAKEKLLAKTKRIKANQSQTYTFNEKSTETFQEWLGKQNTKPEDDYI